MTNTWGGKRDGAGRPKQAETRKNRSLKAYDDEWEVIREFSKIVKTDIEHAKQLLVSEKQP